MFWPFTQNVCFLFPLGKKFSTKDRWSSSDSERKTVRVLMMSLLVSFAWTQFALQHFWCMASSILTIDSAFCFLPAILVAHYKETNKRLWRYFAMFISEPVILIYNLGQNKMRNRSTPPPNSMLYSCYNENAPFYPSLKWREMWS